MDITRRKFLEKIAKVVMVSGGAKTFLAGCASQPLFKNDLDWVLSRDHYDQLTKDWDPVYGPPIQWFSRYGGPGHFQGHIQGGAVPGVDYHVPVHTPLVPMMTSYLRQISKDDKGVVYILLIDVFNPAYRISYGHLSDVLVDEKYLLSGDVMRYLGEGVKPLMRGEIVALSGNSGFGPVEYGFVQPPHLHLSLYYLNFKNKTMVYLDPEKFGLDGGRPVFWDGETILDGEPEKRITRLKSTIRNFKQELDSWLQIPGLEELRGRLMEYHHLIGDDSGRKILDSKHFHEMRALLKRVTLEEKRHLPGSRPYSVMLKAVGYSTAEEQKVILNLPFIAPGLGKMYKKAVFEEGEIHHLIPVPKPS